MKRPPIHVSIGSIEGSLSRPARLKKRTTGERTEGIRTYAIDLCEACASGDENGEYVSGCAFCDCGPHPHPHLYESGWLKQPA